MHPLLAIVVLVAAHRDPQLLASQVVLEVAALALPNLHCHLGIDPHQSLHQVRQLVVAVCGNARNQIPREEVALSCVLFLAEEELVFEQNHVPCYLYRVALYQHLLPYLNKEKIIHDQ
jgi:hypothetical protein